MWGGVWEEADEIVPCGRGRLGRVAAVVLLLLLLLLLLRLGVYKRV
tara:strand:+ start:352 stop:489 length:138 start_codon:yes stop_codon:yes gene_type:complete